MEDIDPTIQLLSFRGYKLVDEEIIASIRKRPAFLSNYHHFTFVNPASRTPVELHWKAMRNSFLLPPGFEQRAFSRVETINLGNEPISVLSWIDNFLFLCAHGANDGWFRLKWLCDIAALFRCSQPIEWEAIAAEICRLGLERSVAQAAFYLYERNRRIS